MLRNKLVRSDGSLIDSSVIISCEFTEEVNSNTNLSVGDVTASEISVEMRSSSEVEQNEVLTYYIIEDGVETLIGVFNAEKPTVASRTSIKFSAFDNIAKTEKIFSDWLRDNQNLFPMSLVSLVTTACAYCGLTLSTTAFPQSDVEVNAFYADGISCRQILAWAGAIAGRYVRANSRGEIEFAWYTDATNITVEPSEASVSNVISVTDDGKGNINVNTTMATVSDDGAGNVSVDLPMVKTVYDAGVVTLAAEMTIPYKQGGLTYETYNTDPIKRVQIKHSDDDIGVIYPEEATGNCFVISENMILGTCSTEVITHVATKLYEQLCTISYRPAQVSLPRTIAIRAGDIINIRDPRGAELTTYVMKMSVTPSGTTVESTGDKSYGENTAVSSEKYKNLAGKVLEIMKSIDGLKIENKDLNGNLAGLELTVEGLRTYVEENFVKEGSFASYKSEVEQTSKNVTTRFESIENDQKETKAHIKTGRLEETEDGPVYGIEVGQTTKSGEQELFNKYARFTSDKLSFYDSAGKETVSIGDQKADITNVEITGRRGTDDYGSFKQGGYKDVTQADGSIITKWVGVSS